MEYGQQQLRTLGKLCKYTCAAREANSRRAADEKLIEQRVGDVACDLSQICRRVYHNIVERVTRWKSAVREMYANRYFTRGPPSPSYGVRILLYTRWHALSPHWQRAYLANVQKPLRSSVYGSYYLCLIYFIIIFRCFFKQ